MDRREMRDLKDRAGRDESLLREQQQVSAGLGHGPVEVYPVHGARSRIPRSQEASARLANAYLNALDIERAAWSALTALPGEPAFSEAPWNAWRMAVEDRDEATRLLINYALSEGEA